MIFIFAKLPLDIIKYILTFNENFLIVNNKIISFILKNDYRYDILKYITLKYIYYHYVTPKKSCTKYVYDFDNDKMLWVYITSFNNFIKYKIKIRRLQKREYSGEKYMREYVWETIQYKYTRK